MVKKETQGQDGISPEKLVALAEDGLNAVRLSKAERLYLSSPEGSSELAGLMDFRSSSAGELSEKQAELILTHARERMMSRRRESDKCPITVLFNAAGRAVHKIICTSPWNEGSALFAFRGKEVQSRVSKVAHIKIGKNELHIRVSATGDGSSDIQGRLKGGGKAVWEMALIDDSGYAESVSGRQKEELVLRGIRPGKYTLKISLRNKVLTETRITFGRES